MSKNKLGISLIALVIVVITTVILAGSIILTVTNNEIVDKVDKAVFLNDMFAFKDRFELYKTTNYMDSNGEYDLSKLQATKTSLIYEEEVLEGDITTIIPEMVGTRYLDIVQIEDGVLVYIGLDDNEIEWLEGTNIPRKGVIDVISPEVTFTPNGESDSIEASTKISVTDEYIDQSSLKYIWDIQNETPPLGEWTNFTNNSVINQSEIGVWYLWARASDNSNNITQVVSESFTVNMPAPEILLSSEEEVFGPLTVTIEYSEDSVENTYAIDDGEYQVYTESFNIKDNCIIHAKSKDSKGDYVENTKRVENIIDGADIEAMQKDVPSGWTGIYTVSQLQDVRNNLSGKYILMKNIDLDVEPYNTGAGWTPITTFYGRFDGNGLAISNLYINSTSSYIGMFGRTSSSTQIYNLELKNANINSTNNYVGGLVGYNDRGTINGCIVNGIINGKSYVGGLVGYSTNANISNSSSTGSVTGTSTYVGGLVGYLDNDDVTTNITNCYSKMSVSGTSQVGGLIGYVINDYRNTTLNITNVYASGDVTGTEDDLGGLIGKLQSYNYSSLYIVKISKACASGKVTGNETNSDNVGGLIGYMTRMSSYSTRSTITDAYASGEVTGYRYVGGLIGKSEYITLTNTYAIGKINSTSTKGGLVGYASGVLAGNSYWCPATTGVQTSSVGTPVPIVEMTREAKYNNWDFVNIWDIQERETTPYLRGMMAPDEVYLENIEYQEYTSGSGTNEEPYIITTEEELYGIRGDMLASYKLGADITLTSYQTGLGWEPIGNSSNQFKGKLDGNGYKISNLYIDNTVSYLGLFGYIKSPAEITNVVLENVDITSTNTTLGSLVGYNDSGIINTCSASGSIEGTSQVGGLVGKTNNGSIESSSTNIAVSGSSSIGGLVGNASNTNIIENNTAGSVIGTSSNVGGLIGYSSGRNITTNSTNIIVSGSSYVGGLIGNNNNSSLTGNNTSGSVTGTSSYVGGLVGYNRGTINNSIVNEEVTGKYYAGGLIGYNNSSISNSSVTGSVEGTSQVGGLVGYNNLGTINTCSVSNQQVEGTDKVGGLVGYTTNANISNSNSTGSVTGTSNYVGGLIGYLDNDDVTKSINNCYSEMSASGTSQVGGLIGYIINDQRNTTLNITNVYASGDVTGTTNDLGGLIGQIRSYNYSSSYVVKISKAYASGKVIGNETTSENVGGLVGHITRMSTSYSNRSTITDAYASGEVTGYAYVGGLVGRSEYATLTNTYAIGKINATSTKGGLVGYSNNTSAGNSYWDTETTTLSTSYGGTGKTTSEMMQSSNYNNWDFTNIWNIQEGTNYPWLR